MEIENVYKIVVETYSHEFGGVFCDVISRVKLRKVQYINFAGKKLQDSVVYHIEDLENLDEIKKTFETLRNEDSTLVKELKAIEKISEILNIPITVV